MVPNTQYLDSYLLLLMRLCPLLSPVWYKLWHSFELLALQHVTAADLHFTSELSEVFGEVWSLISAFLNDDFSF